MEDQLRATIEAIAPLGEADWRQLKAGLHRQRFESGSHLVNSGIECTDIFYLGTGLVREYYSREDGAERTRGFARAGSFTGAYADFLMKRMPQVSIQALQETECVVLSLNTLNDLHRSNPIFETVSRRLLEKMYVHKEKREFQFLTMSAGERYRRLAEDFPEIEQAVQQYHIASYLGITPVALSRIRKQLASPGSGYLGQSERG